MKLLKGAQLKWWELFSSKSNILDVWSGPESASGDGRPKYSSTKQNKTKLFHIFGYFVNIAVNGQISARGNQMIVTDLPCTIFCDLN